MGHWVYNFLIELPESRTTAPLEILSKCIHGLRSWIVPHWLKLLIVDGHALLDGMLIKIISNAPETT